VRTKLSTHKLLGDKQHATIGKMKIRKVHYSRNQEKIKTLQKNLVKVSRAVGRSKRMKLKDKSLSLGL
jgi:hypothetical protein